MSTITIIPDVHGRRFWREVASGAASGKLVFLGDYLDPYGNEGISQYEAFGELQEIMLLKEQYPSNVTLLLGNHDLHYFSLKLEGGRFDWFNASRNKEFFLTNLDKFDMAVAFERFLFTHAGVLKGWYEDHFAVTEGISAADIALRLNDLFHGGMARPAFMSSLAEVSGYRGGWAMYGSPVWADVHEHNPDSPEFEGIFQVFGHTQMRAPVITPHWACLDCHEAFTLETDCGVLLKVHQ